MLYLCNQLQDRSEFWDSISVGLDLHPSKEIHGTLGFRRVSLRLFTDNRDMSSAGMTVLSNGLIWEGQTSLPLKIVKERIATGLIVSVQCVSLHTLRHKRTHVPTPATISKLLTGSL